MTSQKYDFRQFQEELAKLERKVEKQQPAKPLGKKAAAAQRLAMAREEFLVLRNRHNLSVADVVAFFPEEEGNAPHAEAAQGPAAVDRGGAGKAPADAQVVGAPDGPSPVLQTVRPCRSSPVDRSYTALPTVRTTLPGRMLQQGTAGR